jgi:uncharacterized membrane protein
VVAVAPGSLTGPRIAARGHDAARARAMVAATLGLLVAGFALQLLVYGHGGHTAISDLPRVFLHRGVRPDALPYLDKVVEYPVGAGLLLYLAALVSATPFGVLVVTGVVSAALCVAITVVLERRVGARAWRWAVAAPVMLYAFQNWDVFAVAALLLGVLAFDRRRDVAAGAALGVGAVVKLFPAVALPPLAARRWAQGDRRGATRLLGAAAAVVVAVNLPVAVANPAGWRWAFSFQSARQATWGSAEFWLLRLGGAPVHGGTGSALANALSFVALALGLGALTVFAARRPITAAGAAGAAIAIFLLANKVYSPTYDLWLVVFFALLPLPRRLWLAFCALDVAVFATVYGYFHWGVSGATVHVALPALVALRTIVLVIFVVCAVRVREAGSEVSAAFDVSDVSDVSDAPDPPDAPEPTAAASDPPVAAVLSPAR